MRNDRPAGRDLNETLLYHTTSASKEVICEEGLDQRLSRQGRFGHGIYFRQANFVWIIAELCSAYPFSPLPLPLSPLPSFLSLPFSSDDPIKCNQYWGQGRPRRMFACYVLLGDIKVQSQDSVAVSKMIQHYWCIFFFDTLSLLSFPDQREVTWERVYMRLIMLSPSFPFRSTVKGLPTPP